MKIHFNPKDFLRKFRLAASVALTKDTKPILQNVKIVATKNHGTILYATDTETGIRILVDADVTKSGTALLPVNRFKKILESIKDERATLETDDKTLIVSDETNRWTLQTQRRGDEFPDVDSFAESDYYEVEFGMLESMIKHTVFATEKEYGSISRSGVALQCVDGRLYAIATNGTLLVAQEWNAGTVGKSTLRHADKPPIVPVNVLNLLSKVMKDKTIRESCRYDVVKMAIKDSQVKFQCGDVTVFARLIDGRFPHWKSIIPKTKNAPCVVGHDDLLSAVKRMQIFTTDQYPCVLLTFERGKLTLSARGAEVGRCQNTMPLADYHDEKRMVKLQCKMLIDMLTTFRSNVAIYLPEGDSCDETGYVTVGSNAVKFTIDGLTYVQAAQAILPEESDELEWERLETKRRHASMRSRLANMERVVKQYRDVVKCGKDVAESESYVEWLESVIPMLESKCAALPADDDESDEPMDDDGESEPIDDEPTHDESESVSVSEPEPTVASGCGECDSCLAGYGADYCAPLPPKTIDDIPIISDSVCIAKLEKQTVRKSKKKIAVEPIEDERYVASELERCLTGLIKSVPMKAMGNVAQIAYLLTDIYPNLRAVSKQADKVVAFGRG